jgi:HNH endonuclease.
MLDLSKARIDTGVGYYYVYDPTHEMANASGKVYVHRYVAQQHYGIKLTTNLHVHHIDENKLNNDPSNLQILTESEHTALHSNGSVTELECKICKKIFSFWTSDMRTYCSVDCYINDPSRKKFEVSADELQMLVYNYPVTKIAEIFGVSDVAIHKRCNKLGVTKMPRGYFLRK